MATIIDCHSQPTRRDFLELTKPKVAILMLITSPIGMPLATKASLDGSAPWQVLIFGNLSIDLCAGAVVAVSRVVGRRIGSIIARAHKRPLARGRVSPSMTLGFVLLLALAEMIVLLAFTNPLATWLTLVPPLGYTVLYIGFLKRAAPQNIVIGGFVGVAPPLLGQVAITGHLDVESLLLVLIVFARTPPHPWALCIRRKDECAKAGIPILPVTHGGHYTKLRILLYILVLFAVSLMPFVTYMNGLIHLLYALALGTRFLDRAWTLYCDSRLHMAIKTFEYSIVYLFLSFMALLADRYLPLKLLL